MPIAEPIVRPLGLITQPNKLGVYPAGALLQAVGVVMRSPGLLTRAPALTQLVSAPFMNEPATAHLFAASDSQYFHIARGNTITHWELTFNDGVNKWGNDFFASGALYQPITFDTTGFVGATRSRNRLLFNSNQGILINDTTQPTSNATALPRFAGMAQPFVYVALGGSGNMTAMQGNTHCSIQVIIMRKFSDGYLPISPPSPACQAINSTASVVDIFHTVQWKTVAQVIAGDVIEVYRTRSQDDTTTATAPGSTYFRSQSYTLTSADIIAGFVTITDKTPDTQLGQELYTNPGVTGSASAKLAPPIAKSMATFKGYTFYFNRTDPASITLEIPGGIYDMATLTGGARKIGFGSRTFTATFTNTSNTLTAISATDIVGLAIGQVMDDPALTGGTGTITAVGASTVTLNTTANTGVTKATFSQDVFDISGTIYKGRAWGFGVVTADSFLTNFGTPSRDVALYASDLVPVGAGNKYTTPKAITIARARIGGGSFTIRASNGANFVPPLPDMSSTALTISNTAVPNGYAWSEEQQPEAVPALNTGLIGTGTIYGAWPTRDAIWVFASDGLWRLSGTGGKAGVGFDWRVDPVDSTLSLSAPQAACVLRDTVYAYTNRGLAAVNDNGVDDTLSVGLINDLLPGPPFAATTNFHAIANETEDEIWLQTISGGVSTTYIYNTLTKAWTTFLGGNSGAQTDVIQTYARFAQGMASIDTSDIWAQSASVFAPCTVDYQPIATENPFAMKQWLDMVLVASVGDATKSVTARFNGVAYNARTFVSQDRDARAGFTVPRNAPAAAEMLSPGFSMTGTQSLSFFGLMLRSNILSGQRMKR